MRSKDKHRPKEKIWKTIRQPKNKLKKLRDFQFPFFLDLNTDLYGYKKQGIVSNETGLAGLIVCHVAHGLISNKVIKETKSQIQLYLYLKKKKKEKKFGQRESIASTILALHATGIAYGPLGMVRSDFRAQNKE